MGQHRLQARRVQGLDHIAKAIQPLFDRKAQGAGNQVDDRRRVQIVNIITHFPLRIEQITKPGGGDQEGHRTFTFDQRIGNQGGAMDGRLDRATGRGDPGK